MDEKLIDVGEIIHVFKKRLWLLILIPIITTSLGALKSSKMQPSYQASTRISIVKNNDLLQSFSEQEVEAYRKFISTFQEAISIDEYLQNILDEYELEYSTAQVRGGLSIGVSGTNLPIITVAYRSGSKDGMEEILETMTKEVLSQIKGLQIGALQTAGVEDEESKVKITAKQIDTINVSTIMPDKKKLVILGFIMGVVLAIGAVLVVDYLDDRVTSAKDLEKMLPVPLLGEIPVHKSEENKEKKKEKKDVSS